VYVNIINCGLSLRGEIRSGRTDPLQPNFFIGKGGKVHGYFGPWVSLCSLGLPRGGPNLGHNTRSVFDLQKGGCYLASVGVVPKSELRNTNRSKIDPWSFE
jgi:hypothetical protein